MSKQAQVVVGVRAAQPAQACMALHRVCMTCCIMTSAVRVLGMSLTHVRYMQAYQAPCFCSEPSAGLAWQACNISCLASSNFAGRCTPQQPLTCRRCSNYTCSLPAASACQIVAEVIPSAQLLSSPACFMQAARGRETAACFFVLIVFSGNGHFPKSINASGAVDN